MINVGAATEAEMKEKKARVEDALHATRAAVEEGIVPGGGVALIRAQRALKGLKLEEADEQIGVDIIRRAIEEPIRMIVHNAGGEGSIVVEKVRASKDDTFGYNALTDTYEDLVAGGRHRSDQGDPHGAAERGVDRRPSPHDRSADRREEGREAGAMPAPPAAAWAGCTRSTVAVGSWQSAVTADCRRPTGSELGRGAIGAPPLFPSPDPG